jgi:hypothetical protein
MMILRVTILISGIALVAGCAEPPQPRSVQEFVDNPIVLEAALVRCSRNRSETRYDAECVNAREANKIIAASEEAERRAEFEAQSERKRQALRRAQEAAAEARRRAAEAAKRREEAAYLAQFGQLPPDDSQQTESPDTGNEPIAVIPEPAEFRSPPTSLRMRWTRTTANRCSRRRPMRAMRPWPSRNRNPPGISTRFAKN